MDLFAQDTKLSHLSTVNLLIGKNGSGKSRTLRLLSKQYTRNPSFNIHYLSPERGGRFEKDANILHAVDTHETWVDETRQGNQSERFKTVSLYRLLDIEAKYNRRIVLNESLRLDHSRNFRNDYLSKLNSLLTNITVDIDCSGSNIIIQNIDGETIQPNEISSGESELISLATEIFYFFFNLDKSKENILLIDEPDVHLHPDAQAGLANFVIENITNALNNNAGNIYIIISTHSTPLICSLIQHEMVKIGLMQNNKDVVDFKRTNARFASVSPFFGHPLSKMLSDDPLFIVEGADDERVWRQAVRSSEGKLKLFPCVATSVNQQTDLERFSSNILEAIYDKPIGYSVRDGDGKQSDLCQEGCIKRHRLQCYAIENLLLTDESLEILGSNWSDFQQKCQALKGDNPCASYANELINIARSGDRMRHVNIKKYRESILRIYKSQRAWENHVGQAIWHAFKTGLRETGHSVVDYIGKELLKSLNP